MIKIAATRGAGTVYVRAYVEVGVIDIAKASGLADAKIANIAASGGWEKASTDDKLQSLDFFSYKITVTTVTDGSTSTSTTTKTAA